MQLGDRFRWETGRCIHGFAHLARGAFTESYAAFAEAYDSAASDGARQVRVGARGGQLAGLSLRGAAGHWKSRLSVHLPPAVRLGSVTPRVPDMSSTFRPGVTNGAPSVSTAMSSEKFARRRGVLTMRNTRV